MRVPTHARWCQTIASPTDCRTCGVRIWWFTCTCDSVVLFDALGPPWPEHPCFVFHSHRAQTGASAERALDYLLNIWAPRTGRRIPDEVLNALQREARLEKAARKGSVLRIDPGSEAFDFIGRIAELNPKINFYRRFEVAENETWNTKSFLGKFGQDSYAQLIVREETETGGQLRRELEAFALRSMVRAEGLSIGDSVQVSVETYELPSGLGEEWLVTDLRILP